MADTFDPNDPLAELTPEMLAMPETQQKLALLRQQLAEAQQQGQPSHVRHTTGLGAALGGIADIIGGVTAQRKESDVRNQMAAQQAAQNRTRSDFINALMGRGSPQPQAAAPAGGGQGIPPLLARPQEGGGPDLASLVAEPSPVELAQARAAALRSRSAPQSLQDRADELRRYQSFARLGMLSGDPAMTKYGATEMENVQKMLAQQETGRHNLATEEQDAWATIADPVQGGIVMYNRKTGETRPLTGGGSPGRLPPLKPQQFEEDLQKLGKDMEPMSKMAPDLATLRKAAEAQDQAGFGPLTGRVPDVFTSPEGIKNRQAALRIMSVILQAQSGTAVSEKEVDRALQARGLGQTASPEQFKQGVAALQSELTQVVADRQAKYRPEIVKEYGRRGGFTSSRMSGDAANPAAQIAGSSGKRLDVRGRIAQLKKSGAAQDAIKQALNDEYTGAEINAALGGK